MAFDRPSEGGIDYAPCRYGMSKLLFRGPRRDTTGDYVAFLGSTETYGKFIETPFPERVAELSGLASVNLGCVNAGVDTFHDDETVIGLCRQARACVVQVMGADRLSNRLYSVHARRNDRFVRATPELSHMYPNVDFAEVHFTRHLLTTLRAANPGAFEDVARTLSRDWVARMESLIARVRVPVILLLLREPEDPGPGAGELGPEPLFVTDDTLAALEPSVAGILRVPAGSVRGGLPPRGMVFSDVEAPMARGLPGPDTHDVVAQLLKEPLLSLWEGEKKSAARITARRMIPGEAAGLRASPSSPARP